MKYIKFDSFDVKAIVTKNVVKKRNVIVEFLSCDFDERVSYIFQNRSYPKAFKSDRPEVFCKKGVLRNFTKFIKKETLAQVFFCEFWEISKNSFLHRTHLVAASGLYQQHF